MYANRRVTPVQRMRHGGSIGPRQSATQGVGPSPKRRSSASVGSTIPKMNGDYHVLKSNVDKERTAVRQARAALANSLDQLGEHHVRQHEYDDAMDAFTEALREKRSVYSQITSGACETDRNHTKTSPRHSSYTSSFVCGMEQVENADDSSILLGEHSSPQMQPGIHYDQAIDEIVNTLRNMGNVHSLRGEQDEAMRYFTEVTSLRARKSSTISLDPTVISAGGESRSLLSGLNDDTSTLMSEINEDVKALDDLFRSISFRNNQGGAHGGMAGGHSDKASTTSSTGGGSTEKRKSKQYATIDQQSHSSSHIGANKRRKSSLNSSTGTQKEDSPTGGGGGTVENEPFNRASSASNLPTSGGNEVAEAIEMYRTVLNDSYGGGPRHEQHKEILNSLTLRAELLLERQRQSEHQRRNNSSASTGDNNLLPAENKGSDLELAIEIYNQLLVAHEESNNARRQLLQQQAHASTNERRPPSSPSARLESSSILEDEEMEKKAATLVASTLICMGSIYYKLGNRAEELQMYRQAKSVYKGAFGEQHVFVAGTRKNIGMVLAERGEYDEAMEQFHKAMRIYLSINNGSDKNRDVASAISCMGNVKNRVGELDAALEKYMEALRIYKSLHIQKQKSIEKSSSSSSSPEQMAFSQIDTLRDVTSTLKVIGMVHSKKGDLDTAMHFFQEAMALLRTPAMVDDSPSSPAGTALRETTSSVLTRIACIHLKKGDLDEAMTNYREAYELTVRNRGTTNHPEVAGILHYIGGIYHKRGEYDEAMACYQESIRIYHATLGPGNPTVAGTLVMVGSIYYKRRNMDSAMMFYREALRLNRDTYGLHHPDVAPILKSIGTILTKKGEYLEAYDVFRDVLSIKCTVHGLDHPEVASAYKSLGNVHYKLGDLADAERQYRHALSIYRRTKGEDHADTIAAKTTIEHLRYWMREREQRQLEQRHSKDTPRGGSAGNQQARTGGGGDDERSF